MHKKIVFPSHPLALIVVVLVVSGLFARLAPSSGIASFLKNAFICAVALSLLMLLGAVTGTVLRDFLLEMN